MQKLGQSISLLIMAILLVACSSKEPVNRLKVIQQKGKLVVGTSADWPPFEFVDQNGDFVGFDISIAKEIGDRLGVEVEIIDMPFDSLIASIQEGKIDIAIAGIAATDERKKVVDFTTDYYWYGECLLVSSKFDISLLNDVEDMANFNVAAGTGTTGEYFIEENLINTGLLSKDKFFLYERAEQGARDILAKRIDIYQIDCAPAWEISKKLNGLKVIFSEGQLPRGTTHIAVPKGEKELLLILNETINDFKSSGFISELENKWIKTK